MTRECPTPREWGDPYEGPRESYPWPEYHEREEPSLCGEWLVPLAIFAGLGAAGIAVTREVGRRVRRRLVR